MLLGNRVRLRAIERSDLPHYVAWLNDPEVRRGLILYQPLSLRQEELWYENILKQPVEEQPLTIEVDTPGGWIPIGNISLMHLSWQTSEAEIGLFIGEKQYWSQGYGREAMEIMLRHAFQTLNLHRVFLRVHETNPRAIRSYEKTGFVHEGRMRDAYFSEGEYIDVLLMGILRNEWQERLREQSRE